MASTIDKEKSNKPPEVECKNLESIVTTQKN